MANFSSGQNIITATTAPPSLATSYEKTNDSNETGVFVWVNNAVEVHGYSNGAWSQLQVLGDNNRFITVSWSDYTNVYFRGVNKEEKIRVFLRVTTSGVVAKAVATSRLDKVSVIPDVSSYTASDEGKLATIDGTGEVVFQTPPVSGTSYGANVYPKIDSIDTAVLDASATTPTRVAITGTGFLPASKIYVFNGIPTGAQTSTPAGFETSMLNNIAADADVIMDQSGATTEFTAEKIVVGWTESNNEYGGVASYGYVNSKKMVMSLNPVGANAGSTFSILIVNPNGKKALYQNCFAVETMEIISVTPNELETNDQSALQIIGKNFDSNTEFYLYDGTESAADRAALTNYKSNAFTFQDSQTVNTTAPLTFNVKGPNYTIIANKGGTLSTLSNAIVVADPPAWVWADTTLIPAANWNDTEKRVINLGSVTALKDYPISTSANYDGFRVMFRFGAVDGDWRYSNIAITYADDATQFWRVQRTRPGTMYSAYYTGGSSATAADALLNQPGIYSHRYDTYPAALAVAPDGTVTFERVHEDGNGDPDTFEVIYTFPTLVDVSNASAKQLRLTFAASNSSIGDLRISE